YQLLENDVIPAFYNDKHKWTNLMRASIEESVQFTAHRMIAEYEHKFYTKVKEEVPIV
ncbi:uncharacterized protein METZ01_LOCUS235881, partial [marine metagenome]